MKLFSFKKKKPSDIKAREAKKKLRGAREDEKTASFKEETRDQRSDNQSKKPTVPPAESFGSASEVIIRPRITEKGTDIGKDGAHAFEVLPSATKNQISEGIQEMYGVTPKKVRTIRIPTKRLQGRRGERGITGGGKKAYVYLEDGDTIDIV